MKALIFSLILISPCFAVQPKTAPLGPEIHPIYKVLPKFIRHVFHG